jgi:cholesterol transport system auxiliary component
MLGLGAGTAAPATYNIVTPKVSGVQSSRLTRQITVSTPTAIRALDTDRIMVSGSGGRISYYGDSAWSDRLTRLVQARMVEAMQDSGAFKAVLTNQDRVDGDYAIATEIRAFQLDVEGGSSSAVVAIFCKIVDERHGRVVATREFSARRPAAKDDAVAAVAALQESFNQVTTEMIRWLAVPRGNSGA